MIPYGRHLIEDDDIRDVVETLRSDWLTTGPQVSAFEDTVRAFTGAEHAVAVNSGTAALHAAMHGLRVGVGDEVILPAITFAATANAVLYQGGTPVFADVDPGTMLLDPASVAERITPRTKAIIGVDYAGQPCDYDAIRRVAEPRGIAVVADACHSLGGEDRGRKVGTLAEISVLSFHPVKHVTTAEGGMLLTDNAELAERARRFRHHGIDVDPKVRAERATWEYHITELGYNYRLSDLHCALGVSQMRKLPRFLERRRAIAQAYDQALAGLGGAQPLATRAGVRHAYHLYVVKVRNRENAFAELRSKGIGVNVHYLPVYWHPLYEQRGYGRGACPRAEAAYSELLSIPLHPGMSTQEVEHVIQGITSQVTTLQEWE